jgi:hypothetical protein
MTGQSPIQRPPVRVVLTALNEVRPGSQARETANENQGVITYSERNITNSADFVQTRRDPAVSGQQTSNQSADTNHCKQS